MSFSRPRTRRKGWWIGVTIGVAVALITGVSLWSDAGRESTARSETPKEDAPAAVVPPQEIVSPDGSEPETRGRFRVGDESFYRVWKSDSVWMQADEAFGANLPESVGAPEFNQTLTGTLRVRVHEQDPRGWILGFEFLTVESNGRTEGIAEPMPQPEVAETMAGEVLARVAPSGELERVVFPGTSTSEARNGWRDLLAKWQVLLPARDESEEWETEETDNTGVVLVRYRKSRIEGLERITREKLGYLSIRTDDDGTGAEFTDIVGEARIILDPMVLTIDGTETIVMRPTGTGLRIESQSDYAFDRFSCSQQVDATPLTSERLEALEAPAAVAALRPEHGDAYLANDQVEDGITLPDLLARIEEDLLAFGLYSPEIVGDMMSLVELIRKDPTVAAEILSILAGTSTGAEIADLSGVLISCLGEAGTAEAQSVLLHLIEAPNWSELERQCAIVSFFRVATPVPQADELLRGASRLGDENAASALLALGAIADRTRSSDPERVEEIASFLEEEAELAITEGRREGAVTALHALGNSAPDRIPLVMERAVDDPDPSVRAAACRALGRVKEPAAELLLDGALRRDPAEEVRLAAMESLSAREEVPIPALCEIVRGERFPLLRLRAIESLGPHRALPAVRAALDWAATADGQEQNRRRAQEWLERG